MMELNDKQYRKYSRQITLDEIGQSGQLKLMSAKVLIVGVGGLGVPALQYLAGAGVGTIGIIDGDVIDLSNLQRQVIYSELDLGKPKVEAAEAYAKSLNSEICIHSYHEHLTFEKALSIFPEYDIIIDGTDNFEARYLINDAAVNTDKPVVSGALFKYEGQLTVYHYQNGPTYRCLFPKEDSLGFGCNETGILGPMAGLIGSLMAMEVLKVLLSIGDVLSGKIQVFKGLTNSSMLIEYTRNEEMVMLARARKHKMERVENE